MRHRGNQAVSLQQPKRFPNRRPADARHLAQLALDQALARLQGSGHDRFAQLLRDHRADGRHVSNSQRGWQFSAFVHRFRSRSVVRKDPSWSLPRLPPAPGQ
jgi:hypothetical protein